MQPAQLVRTVRSAANLSVRALAEAAGVAASTVHRIEQGELEPTVETLRRITEAAGQRLSLDARADYAASVVGLALSVPSDLAAGDALGPIRKAAELAARFAVADPDARRRMITAEPPPTGDDRWDVFLAGLVEWMAVQVDIRPPDWVHDDDRYLRHGWWVTPMRSVRAWEYAGTPVSFQSRGIYLHRDSLTNV